MAVAVFNVALGMQFINPILIKVKHEALPYVDGQGMYDACISNLLYTMVSITTGRDGMPLQF